MQNLTANSLQIQETQIQQEQAKAHRARRRPIPNEFTAFFSRTTSFATKETTKTAICVFCSNV